MTNSQASLDEIKESFGFFDDWEDKYRFIIDLGKALETLPDSDRQESNLVRGCQSQVWLVPAVDSDSGTLQLRIDSDAHIVRGLIAIVLAVYDGRTPEDALAYDIEGLFEDLALLKHLSPTRGNGLRALIGRIRDYAEAA
ncbi:MAG: SufE family protein [Pseudomonadota bacterium]